MLLLLGHQCFHVRLHDDCKHLLDLLVSDHEVVCLLWVKLLKLSQQNLLQTLIISELKIDLLSENCFINATGYFSSLKNLLEVVLEECIC